MAAPGWARPMKGGQPHVPVQPLTRRNREGTVYRRDPGVESQIDRALALEPARLLDYARLMDRACPGYLQEEALVYLIRAYHGRGERTVVNALSEALIRRCAKSINDRLQALGPQAVEDAFRDVIAEVFEMILDLASDRGDYLQVRFWIVVKRRTITVFGRYVRHAQVAQETVRLAALAGHDLDREDDDPSPSGSPRRTLAEPAITTEQLILSRDGLNALTEPHRTAFVLRYYAEWPVEDDDPAVPTISRYFDKTPRTIRNWLAKAEETLVQWRGAQR